METRMSAVVTIKPHPLYGGIPFDKEVKFDTGAARTMVSEDLIHLFGTMEATVLSPVVSVNDRLLRCVGLVEFSVEFVQRIGLGFPVTPGGDHLQIPDVDGPGVHEN